MDEIVVLFAAKLRHDADRAAYEALSARMSELVAQMPGFLGVTNYREEEGEEVDVVRFASDEAVRAWARHPEHREAQRRGREEFYESYRIEVARVLRAHVHP